MSAVARNDLQEVDKLLSEGAVDVNVRVPYLDQTALGSAAGLSEEEMVRLLLRRGADPNIGNKDNLTPLQSAAHHGNIAIVTMLLKAGARVNTADSQYGYTALASATQNGHIDVVRALLEAGADPNLRLNSGWTVAELALQKGWHQIEQLLVAPAPSTPQPEAPK